MNEYIKRLKELRDAVISLEASLKLDYKEAQLKTLETQMQATEFWDDTQNAQSITQNYNQLKNLVNFWRGLAKDIVELLDLAEGKEDAETLKLLEEGVPALEAKYKKERVVALLNKSYDDHSAIVALHSGAGGTDAQDWTEMLLRMYLRFFEKKGWQADILESSKGSEAGIKSVLISVKGPFAYGYLKTEAGVHRLVRLSPYNPAHTRETSFALVEVLPELAAVEQTTIDPKDLKIEITTSSGAGGQSVNTTYSAVRMTHIPTGIKVSIQNERSQAQNREIALQIIQAKLKILEEEKLQDQKKELRGEFKSAEWGNQIRSYVLHPYKLVKDHRTGLESTDPDTVLNGELEEFIEKTLELKV